MGKLHTRTVAIKGNGGAGPFHHRQSAVRPRTFGRIDPAVQAAALSRLAGRRAHRAGLVDAFRSIVGKAA